MLQAFGHWCLSRSRNAWVSAGLLAPLPLIGWVSAVICVLVTLRRGMREGAAVAFAASIPFIVWMLVHQDTSVYVLLKLISLPTVWIVAGVLRESRSWYSALAMMTMMGITLITALYVIVGDMPTFWQQHIMLMLNHMQTVAAEQNMELLAVGLQQYRQLLEQQNVIRSISQICTGLFVANAMISIIVQLVLARQWQSKLFNPTGLQKELHQLTLPVRDSFLLLGIIGAAMLSIPLFVDMIPVALLPFAFVGLCVMHRIFYHKQFPAMAFYGLCFVIAVFMPYTLMMLVMLAIWDSFASFKARRDIEKSEI